MNTNYEVLRGGHRERDIYSELKRIEERGKTLKGKKSRFSPFGRRFRNEDGAASTV